MKTQKLTQEQIKKMNEAYEHRSGPNGCEPGCEACAANDSKPQHTPTPLKIAEVVERTDGYELCSDGNPGVVLAFIDKKNYPVEPSTIDAIVRAVNSHEALLKALKELRDAVIRHNQEQFQTSRQTVKGFAIHEADKAIAQAEGK